MSSATLGSGGSTEDGYENRDTGDSAGSHSDGRYPRVSVASASAGSLEYDSYMDGRLYDLGKNLHRGGRAVAGVARDAANKGAATLGSVATHVMDHSELALEQVTTHWKKFAASHKPSDVHSSVSLLSSGAVKTKERVRSKIEQEYAQAGGYHDGLENQHWFVDHKAFQVGVYFVIFLNTIFLAYTVETKSTDPTWLQISLVGDYSFTVLFGIEMILKLYFMRGQYWHNVLNVVDFVLVVLSVVQLAYAPAGDDAGLRKFTLVRVLRLIRLVRVMRLATAKRELIMLVEGVGASLRPMFWIGILFLLAVLVCSILCKDLIGDAEGVYTEEDDFDNKVFFGSITRSAVSLINVALISDTWDVVSRPLSERQPYLMPFFLIFIAMTSLGVMNVIVGVIVERTSHASSRLELQEQAGKRALHLEKVVELAEMLFPDGDDEVLTAHALTERCRDEPGIKGKIHEAICAIDFPFDFEIGDLHTMLDQDGDGNLNETEVLRGLTRLIQSGPFQHECIAERSRCHIKRQLHMLRRDIESSFLELRIEINELRQDIRAGFRRGVSPERVGRRASNESPRGPKAELLGQHVVAPRDSLGPILADGNGFENQEGGSESLRLSAHWEELRGSPRRVTRGHRHRSSAVSNAQEMGDDAVKRHASAPVEMSARMRARGSEFSSSDLRGPPPATCGGDPDNLGGDRRSITTQQHDEPVSPASDALECYESSPRRRFAALARRDPKKMSV